MLRETVLRKDGSRAKLATVRAWLPGAVRADFRLWPGVAGCGWTWLPGSGRGWTGLDMRLAGIQSGGASGYAPPYPPI